MNKKSRFKMGSVFGLIMFVFYVAQNLLTADTITATTILKTLASSFLAAAIGGFLFGWLMGAFANSKFVEKETQITLKTGETILHSTLGNHIKGIEAVGGKLYLTNQRVVFKSHKLNFQRHALSIDLNDIAYVQRYKTLGLINNAIAVISNENKKEKFVVEQREIDGWVFNFENRNIRLKTI